VYDIHSKFFFGKKPFLGKLSESYDFENDFIRGIINLGALEVEVSVLTEHEVSNSSNLKNLPDVKINTSVTYQFNITCFAIIPKSLEFHLVKYSENSTVLNQPIPWSYALKIPNKEIAVEV